MGGWVAGKCETITNSASAEAGVEALAELGNKKKRSILTIVMNSDKLLYIHFLCEF